MSFVGNDWLINQIIESTRDIERLIKESKYLTDSKVECIICDCESIRERIYQLKLDESRKTK